MELNAWLDPGFPPALVFLLGAAVVPFVRGRAKSALMLLLPLVSLAFLASVPHGTHWEIGFLDYRLILGRVDSLSLVFGVIFSIISFLAILFALRVQDDLQHVFGLCYAGSALGVTFAGDLFSLYVFWEIMAVSSAVLVFARRTESAVAAAYRYILVHILGGLFLLAGILLYVHKTGSVEFASIGLDGPASLLIFIGVALNAAVFPLHAWLPDAYPQATATGAVFLSAFTTKSAVYLMARAFPGTEALIWLGAVMAVIPVFYAVLEDNVRRVLSYCLISIVGFMLVGVGIGTPLAINGAVALAFAHILYKSLLFMASGAVLDRTGRIKCTELGGLYRTMPLTCAFCLVGAASVALPLFGGFVSKAMILSAAGHHEMAALWLVLQFASAGVFLAAGLKVPYFAFFGRDAGLRPKEAPFNMLAAMGLTALLCLVVGLRPHLLYGMLPHPVEYAPYTVSHVLSQLQLLLFGGLAFCLLVLWRLYPLSPRAIHLDTDWFYRQGAWRIHVLLAFILNQVNAWCDRAAKRVARAITEKSRDFPARLVLIPLAFFWVLSGYRGKRLELIKKNAYNELMETNIPVGIGAGVTVLFVTLFFVLINWL